MSARDLLERAVGTLRDATILLADAARVADVPAALQARVVRQLAILDDVLDELDAVLDDV